MNNNVHTQAISHSGPYFTNSLFKRKAAQLISNFKGFFLKNPDASKLIASHFPNHDRNHNEYKWIQ